VWRVSAARICVSGTITEHKGKPEIKVTDPAQIKIISD
jgi:DNA/RNA endonuclease YhcR with UshA esterase domain